MPGIILFNRRWNVSSDDLFYPTLLELLIRAIWFFPQLFYFYQYPTSFQCNKTELLLPYFIGFLILMVVIILCQLCIIIISSRGTITNDEPRKRMNIFIYIRIFLTLGEAIFSILGTIWLSTANLKSCSLLLCLTVLANILFFVVALCSLLIVTFFIFDPISHLPENDYIRKRNILYDRLKMVFFCCYCCLYTSNTRSPHYENSYRQISSFLE
jgi:sn1-specific diacylglycerol lipase